ncbi:DUF421 domain-containing protein [Bacillus solitudinis]|uniref:DUF421 domain-containing protein n=1 Tax=Bacillus solitudinis TaxID=2014074 RepID=UPI000C235288|nr:DUF421 domain-containing protein [Bacillus solitudinis]
MNIDMLEWAWKSVIIVVAGTILLRIAGRKSISQMTLAQTVIMIGIGSLLIQPLAGENIWSTLYVGLLLVLTLLLIEYGQIKFNTLEQLVTGKAKILIEDGEINLNNLSSVRLTIDQLEMQLREKNVSNISDVKWATLEPNGQLGFLLKEEARTPTKKDIDALKKEIQHLKQAIGPQVQVNQDTSLTNQPFDQLSKQIRELTTQIQQFSKSDDNDIFQEVKSGVHKKAPPQHLQ